MTSKLIAQLILRFFGTKTVDNVMGAFNKTLAELRNVESAHTAIAEEHRVAAEAAASAHVAATAEASRARIIASRIESIISVDTNFGDAKLASVG